MSWAPIFNAFTGAVIAALASISAAYLTHHKNRHFLFQILIFIFFGLCAYLWALPEDQSYVTGYIGEKTVLRMRVNTLPRHKNNTQSYRAVVYRLNGRPVHLRVRVNDFSHLQKKCSRRYQIEGKLFQKIYKGYTYYQLWINKNAPQNIIPSLSDTIFYSVQNGILKVYRRYLADEAATFLSSVFLGRRELLSPHIKNLFLSTGTVHLLAISGLHMGLVMAILVYMLQFAMLSFSKRIIISLNILFFYVFLVGPTPATIRAAIMCAVFGVSFLLRRKTHPLNSLGIAGMICLIANPVWITHVGFQLSFLSVLGIIAGYKFFPINMYSDKLVVTYIKNIFFSSVLVTVFIWPLTAWYFHYVHLWTILINIVVIPFFIGIIFVNCIMLIFSWFPLLAGIIAEVLSLSVRLFLGLLEFFSKFPLAITVRDMDIRVLIIYYGLLTVLFGFLFWKRYGQRVSFPGRG